MLLLRVKRCPRSPWLLRSRLPHDRLVLYGSEPFGDKYSSSRLKHKRELIGLGH